MKGCEIPFPIPDSEEVVLFQDPYWVQAQSYMNYLWLGSWRKFMQLTK